MEGDVAIGPVGHSEGAEGKPRDPSPQEPGTSGFRKARESPEQDGLSPPLQATQAASPSPSGAHRAERKTEARAGAWDRATEGGLEGFLEEVAPGLSPAGRAGVRQVSRDRKDAAGELSPGGTLDGHGRQ